MTKGQKPHNEEFLHGFAEWAEDEHIREAGLFERKPDSVFMGFRSRRPVYAQGQAPVAIFSPPRSGKLTMHLAYNCLGPDIHEGHHVYLDVKGEEYAIARNQTWAGKHLQIWNPQRLHDFPSSKFNPTGHIRKGDPYLVAKCTSHIYQFAPLVATGDNSHFEKRMQELAISISIIVTERDGVLMLSAVHRVVNKIATQDKEWLEIEFRMLQSKEDFIVRVGNEIRDYRRQKIKNGETKGDMKGIISDLFKAYSCLNDPVLRESISPPYDISIEDLCHEDTHPTHFHLVVPESSISAYAPVLKSAIDGLMSAKTANPFGSKVVLFLDEVAQLNRFPLIEKLVTLGAGVNLKVVLYFQSVNQMDKIAENAKETLKDSISNKLFMQFEGLSTTQEVSEMLGTSTQAYDDTPQQQQAAVQLVALKREILQGNFDRDIMRDYKHFKNMSEHRSKIARPLRTSAELLAMKRGKMVAFIDGLSRPVELDGIDYFTDKRMNGFWMPNPYYPPTDRVTLPGGFFGKRTRRVITEQVPEKYADYPQYKDGQYSYIEGYKP